MKTAFLLCIAISAGLLFGGCANQNQTASPTTATNTNEGLPPGAMPGISGSGGGGGGGAFPVKTQP